MKKRTIVVLLIISALLDSFFAYICPIDFSFQSYSFKTHFCFILMIYFLKDEEWQTRLLASMLCGLLYDFLIGTSFPTCTIMYPLLSVAAVIVLEQVRLNQQVEWATIVVSSFLLEFVPFLIYGFRSGWHVGIGLWFIRVELLTIIADILLVIALYYFLVFMLRRLEIRAQRQSQKARRKYRSVKEK